MKMNIFINIFAVCLIVIVVNAKTGRRKAFALDENWVCNVKKSCLDCLRLSQCSWCEVEKRCFSRHLPKFDDYCKKNATEYQNYGLSFVENARCACAGGQLEENCVPEDDNSGLKCSGRGECLCGRCVCDSKPDPDHPTKVILGQYCEYDNFSCDGPRCNEGPFHYLRNESTYSSLPPE